MGDEKSEDAVARTARDNFEKQWKYYQSLSSYNQRAYRRENGILREQMSGREFYNHVRNQIDHAGDKEECARNIIRRLMENPSYLVNAVTDMDGRRGLSILVDDWQGEARLRGVVRDAMNKQGKEYTAQHQKIFDQNFQKYAQDFKEEVEKQGQYKVERVYYVRRDLPWESEKFNEIRAEMRQIVAKHETKGGEIKKIFSSEKKDIPIALFNRVRGDFVPSDYIHRKDKPLEKGFADWVAESVVDFGIGAIVRASGKILVKGGEIAVKGIAKELSKDAIGEGAKIVENRLTREVGKFAIKEGVRKASSGGGKFAEKGLVSRAQAIKKGAMDASGRASRANASRSLSEAVARERISVKGPSKGARDTVQDMGDTFDLSKFERKMSGGPPPSRRLPTTQPPLRPRLPTTRPLNAQDAYSEGIVDFIGMDVAEKAARIGIDQKQLGTMIWLAESRGMMKKPSWAAEAYEWGYLPEGIFPSVSKATKEVVRRDIQATYSLGEDTARRLITYGHDPHDISRMIDASAAKGLNANEIRQQFTNELKLMNYYRDTFHPGLRTLERARAALTPAHSAPGDAYVNIRSEIFQRLVNKYKRQLDATHGRPSVWDELPGKATSKIFLDLHETADKITQHLMKRILGLTPAVIPLSALRKDRSIEEEKKMIEEAEARKTETKRIETEQAETKEIKTVKTQEIEAAQKSKAMENAKEQRASDKLRFSKRKDDESKGTDRESEIEKEAKREKERLIKIKEGPPRSAQEAAARAREQKFRAGEEVRTRETLGYEGLKALQKEQDEERLAYDKADTDQAKGWAEYEEWKKNYMEEKGLSSEEEFEESLASDEGAWDIYEDLMGDEERSGGEGWDDGLFGGEDEGGFGHENEGGFGGEDDGKDEDTYGDRIGKEKKGKEKGPGAGGKGGESGGGGGGGGSGGGGGGGG